ncbi:MAG TPA: FtsW/RodA/SpoVE family cell cycle protein [Trebonia sp.]|jgi:cell division protein FtsW (lipid II flippase)|nr:FtsW/RodA/SpoVE family cell cycle protein [Trebonia sp.]
MSSLTMPTPAVSDPDDVPGPRRNPELRLLFGAFGVVAFAYVNVAGSLKGQHASAILGYMIAFMVVTLGAHLAIRHWAPYADPLLLPVATLLNGLGIVFIYRLSLVGKFGNPGNPGTKSGLSVPVPLSSTLNQIIYTLIGIACFVAVLKFIAEPRVLQRYTYILGLTGLILIALPAFLPSSISGVAGTGAKIQISIGGFSLQPGEFGRLALAAFFAGYLVAKRDVLALAGKRVLGIDLPRGRDLGPIVAIWALSMLLLVFEADVGMSAVFMGLFVSMLYIATSRTSWLLLGFSMFILGALIAWQLIPHVGQRFEIWLHAFNSSVVNAQVGSSYQLVQGLYGLGNGGLLGKGLGGGEPYWTPLVQSDLIFTGFGEEIGLAGLMAMLVLYALIVQRGLRTALMVKDPFSKLLAGGLSFMFAMQVFVIVGGVTRLIPLTGITTPFLSLGGSSLIANWAVIGLLARLSDTARRPAPKPIQDEGLTQVVSLK